MTTGTSVPLNTSELMTRPRRSRAPLISQTSPRWMAIQFHVDQCSFPFVGEGPGLFVEARAADRLGVRIEDLAECAVAGGAVDPGRQRAAFTFRAGPGVRDRLSGARERCLRGQAPEGRGGPRAGPPLGGTSAASR